MNGSPGEMGSLLKQAQQMQKEVDRAQAELKQRTVEGLAEGGAVKVVVTGHRLVTRVEISDEAFAAGDKARLEELIGKALEDGHARATRLAEETMRRVTGGVSLPGFF